MDEPTLLALVALIVSLIALLVSFTQLLQSSALTAEGWRHCNAINMGQWAVFSRRRWRWSELRAEVKYTTPFVSLMDTTTFYDLDVSRKGNANVFITHADSEGLWHWNEDRLWDKVCHRLGLDATVYRPEELGWGMVFEEGFSFNRPETALARAASHILGFNTLPNGIEHYWKSDALPRVGQARTVWHSCLRWLRGYHFRFTPRRLSSRTKAKNMSITWDGLLRSLLLSQLNNFDTRTHRSTANGTAELRKIQNLPIPRSSRTASLYGVSSLRKGETVFAIDLERRSWDFLPPEVTRPLARSTMQTMVILARRLGMRWRTFDLFREQYRAEGNGCILTASNVRGIGIVFRFDTSFQQTPEPILCSTDADKAYFGIIPGDKAFGIEDYPLVNDNGRSDIEILVKTLGDEAREIRSTLYFWSRIVVNDAVALLCPFMPLPNSRKPKVFTAIATLSRLEIMIKLSLFRAFGCDNDLRSELNKQLAIILKDCDEETAKLQFPSSNHQGTSTETSLKELFDNHHRLKYLWRPIKEDRKNKLDEKTHAVISGVVGRPGDQLSDAQTTTESDIEVLRRIHDAIRDKLLGDSSISGLMHLVEAHTKFVSDCILDWYRKDTHEGQKRPKGPKDHANDDLIDGWDTLLMFCRRLMTNLKTFRHNLQLISPDYAKLTPGQCDLLWWMLVARGTAWQLSVDVGLQNYKDMVPSSVYESEMCVWIE